MTETLFFFFIALLIVFCIIFVIYIALNEHKARKQLDKELKEVRNGEFKKMDIISKADKTKADSRTGDHSADIKYMADKLHDYANK